MALLNIESFAEHPILREDRARKTEREREREREREKSEKRERGRERKRDALGLTVVSQIIFSYETY